MRALREITRVGQQELRMSSSYGGRCARAFATVILVFEFMRGNNEGRLRKRSHRLEIFCLLNGTHLPLYPVQLRPEPPRISVLAPDL
jgi:hypothetical protein